MGREAAGSDDVYLTGEPALKPICCGGIQPLAERHRDELIAELGNEASELWILELAINGGATDVRLSGGVCDGYARGNRHGEGSIFFQCSNLFHFVPSLASGEAHPWPKGKGRPLPNRKRVLAAMKCKPRRSRNAR